MYRTIALLFAAAFLGIAGCQQPESPSEPEPEAIADTPEPVPEPESLCELTLGWDPWEPYHFLGTGGQVEGMDVDLMNALAERVDCELSFQQGNWASLLRQLQSGELDLLLGATRTEERETFARFSAPYRTETFQLFVRPEDTERYAVDSLKTLLEQDFRVGVTQGYIYSPEVSALQSDERFAEQFVEAEIAENNFMHLLDYRIDGFLEDVFVCAAIARRRGLEDEIEAVPPRLETNEVHIMYSRESVDEELVTRFDQALNELRESGEYETIRDRYLNY